MQKEEQTGILLESGTNELEIMEFTVDHQNFGINVAKIREILMMAPIKPMQRSHPNVEGVFKPRGTVLPVVDLAGYLGLQPSKNPERDLFIVTSFNQRSVAFHVHTVDCIDRISWKQMKKPDSVIYGGREGIATAIAEHDGRLITILDFEMIIADISPSTGIQVEEIEQMGERTRTDKPILIAEDSMMLSKMIVDSLRRAGYVNIKKASDGQEAWDYLAKIKENAGDKPIRELVSCLISDIEMPQMDGHRLTKLVKSDPVLKEIPLVLFSSIITEENRIKGQQLGADEQITKPEIARLVNVIDRLTMSK